MKKGFLLKILLVLGTALAATACSKTRPISDSPFLIEARHIQPKVVWADIIPETNDFYYFYGVVSLEDYASCGGNDEALVKNTDESLVSLYEEIKKAIPDIGSFKEIMLYKDAVYEPFIGNEISIFPETDYYLFAYPYTDNDVAMSKKLVKVKFTTPREIHSDINFNVSLEGNRLRIIPTNDDPYIFESVQEKDLKEKYYDNPSLFFNKVIDLYEEFEFIDAMTAKGEIFYDLPLFYDLKPDDVLYCVASGYENGKTSKEYYYKVTYKGPEQSGIVEEHHIAGLSISTIGRKITSLKKDRTDVPKAR